MDKLHEYKDFGGGWSVGLDDGANIIVCSPDAFIRFYPFPILQEDEYEDEYRFVHKDVVQFFRGFSFIHDEERGMWDFNLQVPEIKIHLYNAPLEMKDHLSMLCKKYESNHAVPSWIKDRR